MNNLRKNHHYVSQSYLKAWADIHSKIWTYRVLVSHKSVPEWTQSSLKSIANHQHLFTRTILGTNSDEIEVWMDQEIEAPAQTALSKARSDISLNAQEWEQLFRFIALQDIRNPSKYVELLERWKLEMPDIIENSMQTAITKIQADQKKGVFPVKQLYNELHSFIPMRVSKEKTDETESSLLKTEVLIGRSLWLFSIKHLLTSTYKVFNDHRWNILHAPEEVEWITSDNPIVKLNYYKNNTYDLKGGWGNKGTEIIIPLSPYFLLYTQVGSNNKIPTVSKELAITFNQFIAQNAHRFVFGRKPINNFNTIRPRKVDKVAYEHEEKEWETWHLRHSKLEEKY